MLCLARSTPNQSVTGRPSLRPPIATGRLEGPGGPRGPGVPDSQQRGPGGRGGNGESGRHLGGLPRIP